ncbi:MAG: proteasome subunit beta [Candidatus Marsarchaeota archaeon]|nr:proteasome subunit beta [Candidatus Marsarchaeota archaeon]
MFVKNMANQLPVGGTAVGVVVDAGVVLASEKRFSYGYTVLSKSAKKVYVVGDRLAVAFSGLVGDMQSLSRRLRAHVSLYELDNPGGMSVASAGRLLSTILYQARFTPYFTETLLGGYDSGGPHLYTFDALGSVLPDRYAALGSGAQVAIGILESRYDPHASLDDAGALARAAVRGASLRDIGSGDGVDVVYVDASGCREESVPIGAQN